MTENTQQPLSRADERWLLGAEFARLNRAPRRMVTRSSRWVYAYTRLPRPSAHGSTSHVAEVFYVAVMPRLEKEGWHQYAKTLIKQPQWWYDAVCLYLAQSYAERHIAACKTCTVEDWAWLLAVKARLPKNTELDPEGNTKPEEGTP